VDNIAELEFPFGAFVPPWDIVAEISSCIDPTSWVLVGGLMVQAHAMMADLQPRATIDVDVLIDVLADTANITHVITSLEDLGFKLQESGLRGAPLHRLKRKDQIIDVLIAEHLPSRKRKSAKVQMLPLMETEGGAQALGRKMKVALKTPEGQRIFFTPDILGALVLKAAAYHSDNRNRGRHLDDVALLSSLVDNVAQELSRLHGSDQKRIRAVAKVLESPNHSAWLTLPDKNQIRGQDVLRILSS